MTWPARITLEMIQDVYGAQCLGGGALMVIPRGADQLVQLVTWRGSGVDAAAQAR